MFSAKNVVTADKNKAEVSRGPEKPEKLVKIEQELEGKSYF
jgi:hypothetical protein